MIPFPHLKGWRGHVDRHVTVELRWWRTICQQSPRKSSWVSTLKIVISRKNNPGVRKAVYQIGLITPKVKCFCPVILKVYVLLYYIPYRGRIFQRKAKLSKTRSAGSKLVIVGVWIVKMFFPTLIVSHIPFFGVSPLPQKNGEPCARAVLLDQWPRRSRGNGWWRTQLKLAPPFRGCG